MQRSTQPITIQQTMHSAMDTWLRRCAEVQTEHQDREEIGFKSLWSCYGCGFMSFMPNLNPVIQLNQDKSFPTFYCLILANSQLTGEALSVSNTLRFNTVCIQ